MMIMMVCQMCGRTEQLGSDIDAQITDGLTDAVVGRSSLSHDGKFLAVGAFGTKQLCGTRSHL